MWEPDWCCPKAIAGRQQTLQDWEARLRASEQQREASPEPLVPPMQTAVTAPPVHEGAEVPAAGAPDQDIVTSLMRDPEPDEPSETTQRSRSMTAGVAEQMVDDDVDDAEELTDDDLIEEDDELLADDLIEGETDLHALPEQTPAQQPAAAPAPEAAAPTETAASVLSSLAAIS